MLLREGQLEGMRDTVVAHLPDIVTILRRVRVSDGGGGFHDTWDEFETVACRIGGPLGGETDERSASKVRLIDEEQQLITFEDHVDVRESDRIRWVEGDRLYDVIAVYGRGHWELSRRARVQETDWED